MNVEVTSLSEKSQVSLEITASAEDLKPYLEKAARKLTKDKPLKGFRPGKAPLSVVVEAYGRERVMSEALDMAVPRMFVEGLLEHEIEALGRPDISMSKASLEEGIVFTATVDVMPEVKLGEAEKISAEKREVKVADEDVSKELEHLAKMRSTPLEVARPAQEGDTVTIDFSVSVNGSVLDGGESKNHPVELGKGQFVPGFEEKLKGISAGDERDFTITFPEDYAKEDIRGKEAQVRVKAHAVQKMVVPEINDDFAKKLGQFENLEALKKTLRENMEHEQGHKEKERLRGELIEKLAEASEFGPLPQSLIEGEIDRRIGEFAQMLSWQKKTMEDYLAQQNKTMEQMRSDMREGAEKSVRMSLALREFVKQEKIEVAEEDVKNAVTAYLAKYNKVEQAQAEIDEEELTTQMAANLRNEKGMEALEKKAQITEANIKIKE